ncbi:MAG: hypothetical protein O7C75_21080 [Verrucomicrobia bacterium]|nr:hypothetical protein [Verrucomicrobiota bacterium]
MRQAIIVFFDAMEFDLVVSTLLKEFDENRIRYAVIGGFALGLWDVSRATVDMDFLLLEDDLPEAETILAKFAYRRTYKSENVAQYISDLAPYGQIDVLIAFRKISKSMLERRVQKTLPGDTKIYTLTPEDLIGLKLQASVNDPSREEQESSDMAQLIKAAKKRGDTIDWELLLEYFSLFDRIDQLNELQKRYGQT